jgi:hypothetical protein
MVEQDGKAEIACIFEGKKYKSILRKIWRLYIRLKSVHLKQKCYSWRWTTEGTLKTPLKRQLPISIPLVKCLQSINIINGITNSKREL